LQKAASSVFRGGHGTVEVAVANQVSYLDVKDQRILARDAQSSGEIDAVGSLERHRGIQGKMISPLAGTWKSA